MSDTEHVHEQEQNDKDGVIEYLTQQLDHYKVELSISQAQEQALSRELIHYLIMERDALRKAMQQ